jgi:hypothetical protein
MLSPSWRQTCEPQPVRRTCLHCRHFTAGRDQRIGCFQRIISRCACVVWLRHRVTCPCFVVFIVAFTGIQRLHLRSFFFANSHVGWGCFSLSLAHTHTHTHTHTHVLSLPTQTVLTIKLVSQRLRSIDAAHLPLLPDEVNLARVTCCSLIHLSQQIVSLFCVRLCKIPCATQRCICMRTAIYVPSETCANNGLPCNVHLSIGNPSRTTTTTLPPPALPRPQQQSQQQPHHRN